MKKLLCLTLMVLGCQQAVAEVTYYRYKDKDGNQVITSSLPSDVAQQGYEVISPRGNIIKTIKPAPTQEELANDVKAQEQQKVAEKEAEAAKRQAALQAKKDEILLKSFSSEEDITRSRDEKIASIEVLEGITHENITRLQKQLDEAKGSAEKYKASSQEVPASLQKTIEESQRQIKENEAFLDRKQNEKQDIHTKYQALIDRFQQLHTSHTIQNKP